MKRYLICASVSALFAMQLYAAEVPAASPNANNMSGTKPISLTTDKDKVSYVLGVDLAQNLKRQKIEINPDAFARGLTDEINGSKLLINKAAMEQTLQNFQKNLQSKREAFLKQQGDLNLQAQKKFLEENKAKKGVNTTATGLQYKVLTAGSGAKPTDNDTVVVEYNGRLLNGTVFDSTDKIGKPVTFRLTDVIPGWSEALKLMNQGSTWEIYVPSSLAYGEQGIPGVIGPNEMLIFNVHLLNVKKSIAGNKS